MQAHEYQVNGEACEAGQEELIRCFGTELNIDKPVDSYFDGSGPSRM